MTWEDRPLPQVTPETERFWAGAAEDELLLRECTSCGFVSYYPRAFCPQCFEPSVEWLTADGTGELHTWTVMEQVSGWPDEHLPLVVAYVDLAEGPRIPTALVDCTPEDLEIGQKVRVTFVETDEDGVGVPVFTPA